MRNIKDEIVVTFSSLFMIPAFVLRGFACCVTHLYVQTMWSNCLNNDFDLMNLITLKQKNNNQTNQENKAKIVVQTNAE